jgi:hypothetical protein
MARPGLFAAAVGFVLAPAVCAQSASLTGFWHGESITVKITQTGSSVEMDLGNGVVFRGSFKRNELSLTYTLTEQDTRQRVAQQSGTPEERLAAEKALVGKVITFAASVKANANSMEGSYQDWGAAAKGKDVTVTEIPQKIALARKQPPHCACSVENLVLSPGAPISLPEKKFKVVVGDEDPQEVEREIGAMYGHSFTVKITYRNKRVNGDDWPGDCVLQWLEKSDRPPGSNVKAGVEPDKWTDIGRVVGKVYPGLLSRGTLAPWTNHDRSCPLPAFPGLPAVEVTLTDQPAVFYGKSRTMYFHIIVSSAPHCGSCGNSREVWAKQALDEGPEKSQQSVHPKTQFVPGGRDEEQTDKGKK